MDVGRLWRGFSITNPLFWGVLGLFFSATSCLHSGAERVAVLAAALVLVLACFLAGLRPRWTRLLTLGVGIAIVGFFGFSLWRSGPSAFGIAFLVMGACQVLHSAFFWDEESEGEVSTESAGEEPTSAAERPRKRRRIAEQLRKGDANALLSSVFHGIVYHYGGRLNVTVLKEHERAFLLAYDAWGVIGNGGFHYLFEKNIRGDPHFAETAAAFDAIGCETAADAFRRAFRLFPGGRPPEDVGERLQIYRSGRGEQRHAIDRQFWGAGDEIERALVAHVHSHANEFVELDQLPPRRRKKKRKRIAPGREGREGMPSGSDVDALPHWARVAFAARCGRRVWPLFTANWPDASGKRVGAVMRSLELADQSAAEGRPAKGLEDIANNALQTAGAALLVTYGIDLTKWDEEGEEPEPLPADGNAAVLASFVAKTAEYAARAAAAAVAESAGAARQAFAWARQASEKDAELHGALWSDLERLGRVARRGGWADDTPVPPDLWHLLE